MAKSNEVLSEWLGRSAHLQERRGVGFSVSVERLVRSIHVALRNC